jgi:Domain of unknown function (DUF5916)/Carbohydrate family 9 binding domain-like
MGKLLPYLLLFVTTQAFSQGADMFKPDSVKKQVQALAIPGSLRIDGILKEDEWKAAIVAPRFIQIEPLQGQEPNFDTYIKALYNKQYLYFGIFAKDSLGRKAIRATDFRRDFDYRQHDMLSLSFDGFNDKRNAMLISTNAYGVQRDMLSFDDLYYDLDWDGLWRVRTSRTDSGWYAEIAIPWYTLRYPKNADSVQNWGLNVYRNRRLSNEITALSAFPRVFSVLRMEYAGVLRDLQPPPPKMNIRIQPYFLTAYDQYKNFDSSIKPNETNFKFGGDVKWAINPNAILDLTVNTDFAQADADRQVNNVTRFSVFFPERRQFFLENASLFSFGIGPNDDESGGNMRVQPFFSRRIGLDDNGNPIPIDIGARFVHRSHKRNYGTILMRQRGNDSLPATNFFVARYSENFGKQNRIGGLVTVKNNSDGTDVVSTLDGFFRLGEAHSLNTMAMHSRSATGAKHGFAGFAQYYYSTNRMKIWWTQSVVTKDFDPSLGFVSRKDVIGTTPGIYYYYRGNKLPFKKWLRAYEPSVGAEFYHQASTGKLVERQFFITPVWLNLQNGGYIGYVIFPYYQRLTEPFEPLGVTIPVGEYNYTRHRIIFSTDPSKMLNLFMDYYFGTYFNGKLNSGTWKLQFAPSPHASLTANFNRNRFKEVGEPKTSTTVDLYSIEGRFALNPRLQLIGFYQRNSENNSQNYNIRLAWEYQPLSFIYLVYNRRGFDDVGGKSQTENHFIAKISYLRQL